MHAEFRSSRIPEAATAFARPSRPSHASPRATDDGTGGRLTAGVSSPACASGLAPLSGVSRPRSAGLRRTAHRHPDPRRRPPRIRPRRRRLHRRHRPRPTSSSRPIRIRSTDGFVRCRMLHPGVRPTAYAGPRRRRLRPHRPERRAAHHSAQRAPTGSFKYRRLHHAAHAGALVFDLYKSRSPRPRRRDHPRARRLPHARRPLGVATRVRAGRERDLFEHQFQVVLRRRGGRIQSRRQRRRRQRALAHRGFAYPHAGRQTGTLEAVDLSDKDGALVCLVQVHVRFGG